MKFTEQNIKKGKLISVFYDNDRQKSGIVTEVNDRQITFVYYDTQIDQLETGVVFAEDYAKGKVKEITTLTSIRVKKKDEGKTSNPSFEVTADRVKKGLEVHSVDQLIVIFDGHTENTLATIATLLSNDKKFEFLYKLSVDKGLKLFEQVTAIEAKKDIPQYVLVQIHEQLDRLTSTEKTYQNGSEEFAPDPAKILEEITKRLGGGGKGLGDIFGGGMGPFGGGAGGFGPLTDMFKDLTKNQPNQQNGTNNQPPNPNDLINDMAKFLNDIMNGNGPKR